MEEETKDVTVENSDIRKHINRFKSVSNCELAIREWLLETVRLIKTKTKLRLNEVENFLMKSFEKEADLLKKIKKYFNYINTCWLTA